MQRCTSELTKYWISAYQKAAAVEGNSIRHIYYIYKMADLKTIKQMLVQLKPELVDKYHVSSIGLFGSVVRDDFTSSSDIDIIVDFSDPIVIEFIDLDNYI